MEKKITVKDIPKKKNSNDKKEAEFRKEAVKIVERRRLINLGLAVLLVLIVVFVGTLIYVNSVKTAPVFIQNNILYQKIVQINNNLFLKSEIAKPAAAVNGEQITAQELEDRYNTIPETYKTYITKQDILTQMIDEKILLQEASKLKITAFKEEIDAKINEFLTENQVTREEFEQALLSRNLSLAYVEDFYGKEIILTKLLNETVFSKIIITEKDINDYYYNNLEQFKVPESVNVSHILICHNESQRCVSNLTKEEALEKAKEVKKMLNHTNFGEIAFSNSNEPAAAVTYGNLGWVSREEPFDATFLNATFELNEDEVSQPIETVFGYHLIKVFEKKKAETLDLPVVYDQINVTVSSEKQKDKFTEYLSMLRNESVINLFI